MPFTPASANRTPWTWPSRLSSGTHGSRLARRSRSRRPLETTPSPTPWVYSLLAAVLIALFGNLGLGARTPPSPPATDITVSAAISLKDVLEEISGLYRTGKPDAVMHLNLGASGTLQRQIEQGAPVDVFISASPAQMDALASHKLILADTRKDLVRNTVVLIVPKDRSGIATFQDLAGSGAKIIAIGDPQSVPAGKYAQEVLAHFGLFDSLKPKFVLAKDVRQVLTYVETGNADAGIVYATDARTSSRISVVATAPEDSHSPVIYPVAVIAGSKNPQAAKSFVNFLLGANSAAVFDKYGFTATTR